MTDEKFALNRYSSPERLLELRALETATQKFEPSYPSYPISFEYGREKTGQIGVREIWRRMQKHKWLILAVVTILTTLAAVQVFRTKAWYTASTVIEIGKENSMIIKSEGLTLSDDSDPYYLVN